MVRRGANIVPGGWVAASAGKVVVGQWLRRLCRTERVELIYANTATQSEIVEALRPVRLPVVTHVHELEMALRVMDRLSTLKVVIRQSNVLLAVSHAVRQMLLQYGARAEDVITVQEPVDDIAPLTNGDRQRVRRDLFGVAEDAIVVGACGVPSWRKGTDIFVRVAQDVLGCISGRDDVVFRWIGGSLPNEALTTLAEDIKRLSFGGRVAAIGEVRDADRILAATDIFLSTSREDPNPLVVLEAAAAARPVVCFEGTGGAADLAEVHAARAVPYLDSRAMAAAVTELSRSARKRRALGERAREVVLERNLTQVVAQEVIGALDQVRWWNRRSASAPG